MVDKITAYLRKTIFFYIDQLKGGVIKEAYRTLKKIDTLDYNSIHLIKHQQTALNILLKHAVNTTDFYSHIRGNNLNNFPVINKETIRKQQDRFISKSYKKKDLTTMYTSGSTGTPFCCYQDLNKKKHVIAELLHYSEKAGYDLGNCFIQVRGDNPYSQRSKIKQWLHNHKLILINTYDEESLEDILRKINSSRNSTLLAYSSTYDSLKNYFNKNGSSMVVPGRVRGIISNGQMLFDDTRHAMEKVFQCRCYSRYSNEENGILGIDEFENNVFVLNEAHYIVEIMKLDADEPASKGEIGRIVLTDLYNHGMPMIRYDTGDIGSIRLIKQKGLLKKAIDNFSGRRMDIILDSNGNEVYPHLLAHYFEGFPEVKQFQIIQEDKARYRVKVNSGSVFTGQEKLKNIFRQSLGEDIQITIEETGEIPILSSGKRRMMINLMGDNKKIP